MVADTHAAAERPWYRRWTIVVPLASLLGWGVGWVVHRVRAVEERPLEITAAPSAPLSSVPLPPRTRTLAGTLRGHDGKPVRSALVSLVVADEPHWTYTGEDGSFRLDGLQRGPWTVTFSADDHRPHALTLPDDGRPALVTLPDVPLTLPTLPLAPRVSVQGRVTATDARSFEGCEVLLRPVLPLDELDAPLPRRVLCDAEGRFACADVQVGTYQVVVLPEWAQNGSWPDLLRADGEAASEWTAPAGADEATLALEVVAGGVRGRVADRGGLPVEGALILVSPENDASRVWPPVAAAGDGSFRVLDLPPGRYAVSVRAGSGSHRSIVTVPPRTIVDVELPPLSVEQVPGR